MKNIYLSPFHDVVPITHGEVTTDMFVRFCVELHDALSNNPDLFHARKPGNDAFVHATSRDRYFTEHQGLCFNFVSWLHFKEFDNHGVFVASTNAYHDTVNRVNLHDLHDAAKPVLQAFFDAWINHDATVFDGSTQRAAPHGSLVYPFADQPEYSHFCNIGEVLNVRERILFLIAVSDWALLPERKGVVTADDFHEFLVDWLAFAEEFAEVKTSNQKYHPYAGVGLCGGFVYFVNRKYPIQAGALHTSFTGAAIAFIKNIFIAEGLDSGYPFGFDEYIANAKEGSLHTNEVRIAWVKAHL